MSPIAALDLGGTFLRTGWWQDSDWLLTHTERTVKDHAQPGLIGQIVDAVRSGPAASGLVVATAGTLSPVTGHVHRAANLPLDDVDLKDVLQDELGIPVAILGDAAAATVAEFVTGAARGFSQGAYVTVSTGIGLGIVVRGTLVSGSSQQAGELGHIPVDLSENAPICPCGQRGCLECFASGSGLVARYDSARSHDTTRPLDARDVIRLAEAGDRTATEVVSQGAHLLGAALAVFTRLFAPEVMVIGGGLAKSRAYVDMAASWLHTILTDAVPDAPRPVVTTMGEPSNALVGAALAGIGDPAARRLLEETGFEVQLQEFG